MSELAKLASKISDLRKKSVELRVKKDYKKAEHFEKLLSQASAIYEANKPLPSLPYGLYRKSLPAVRGN